MLDAKIVAAVASVASIDSKVDTKLDAASALAAADIEKLEKTVNEFKEEFGSAAATEVEIAASWQFLANPIQSTNNRNAIDIRVVGKNFQQYDYTPDVATFFECTSADNAADPSHGSSLSLFLCRPQFAAYACICFLL